MTVVPIHFDDGDIGGDYEVISGINIINLYMKLCMYKTVIISKPLILGIHIFINSWHIVVQANIVFIFGLNR